jgi:hypothetical protein
VPQWAAVARCGGVAVTSAVTDSHRSVETCQAFSVVRIGPRGGKIAIRLSGPVRLAWKSFARVAPALAPGDRIL